MEMKSRVAHLFLAVMSFHIKGSVPARVVEGWRLHSNL